jgi:hypothetical protein
MTCQSRHAVRMREEDRGLPSDIAVTMKALERQSRVMRCMRPTVNDDDRVSR